MKLLAALTGITAFAGSALASGTDGSGLVVLNTTANAALSMTGNSTVRIPARAVYVNSNSRSAVRTVGNATLDAPNLFVVGETSFGGHSGCTGSTTTHCVPYADPLSGVRIPTSTGLTDQGSVSITGGGSRVLSPGYYSHGISVTGNSSVTFSPGVYVINGDLRITSGTITGQGVCIVMLGGSLSIAGTSGLTLSPPTSGDLANVVIAQPRSNTTGMSLSGGSGVNIAGSIYAPGANITLTGNSTLEGEGPQMGDLVVADTVTMTGTSLIKIGRPTYQAIIPPQMPLYD